MCPPADAADLGGLRVATDAGERAVVVQVEGELDLAGAPRLAAALESTDAGGRRPLVIDLASVSFIDSTGVRALVDAARSARESERPFALLTPSPAVIRVLDLVDLRRAFVEIPDLSAESLDRAAPA
jgi:anti-anti-sigma factor